MAPHVAPSRLLNGLFYYVDYYWRFFFSFFLAFAASSFGFVRSPSCVLYVEFVVNFINATVAQNKMHAVRVNFD